MPTLADTLALVRTLHASQVDKAGRPYVEHLERVHGHLVQMFPDASDAEQHAALLHDTLEDTATTADDLRARGYGEDVVAIVRSMTKPEGAEYQAYVQAIADAGHVGVIRVKLADNADNGDPERLARLPEEQRAKLTTKYRRAREALLAAIEAPRAT